MEIKPVKTYKEPDYESYTLKNGIKLTAGVAVSAMLLGTLSGCSAVEQIGGKIAERFGKSTDYTIEVIDGDIAAPECTPENTDRTDMLLGEEMVVDSMLLEEELQYEALSGVIASSPDSF